MSRSTTRPGPNASSLSASSWPFTERSGSPGPSGIWGNFRSNSAMAGGWPDSSLSVIFPSPVSFDASFARRASGFGYRRGFEADGQLAAAEQAGEVLGLLAGERAGDRRLPAPAGVEHGDGDGLVMDDDGNP